MTNRQSSKTENILSINNIQRNKQGTTEDLVSTDTAIITTSGTISIGNNPPTSYGDNPGIYIGNEPVPVVSFYSDENNYLKWDGTKLLISSENFSLNSLGTIRAVNGEFTGIISASEGGNIAGWIIQNNLLYSGSGSTTVILDSSGSNPAFSAGSSVSSTAPLRIYGDGTLVATSACITGSMSANTGDIGGWLIGASSIYSDNGDSALNSGITTGSPSIMLGATGYKTGSGVWFGKDTDGIYKFFAGNVSTGSYLSFNGSSLDVKGITAEIATITTLVTVGSGSPYIYIDGINKSIETSNFVADSAGWQITSGGLAEFNNIKARGSIQTAVFIKNLISATAGTLGVFKSAGKLLNDLSTSGSAISIDIEGTDSLFEVNDIVRIKEISVDNWLKITAVNDMITYYNYDCSLQSGTSGSFTAGATVVDYGQNGDGFLVMTADNINSPYYSVNIHDGKPWNGTTEISRFGNLKDFLDVTKLEYGFGVGSGSTYLRYTTGNGLMMKFANGAATITDDGFTMTGLNYAVKQYANNISGSNLRYGWLEMFQPAGGNIPAWGMTYSNTDTALVTNGDAETGNLTGWTDSGSCFSVTTSAAHYGSYGFKCKNLTSGSQTLTSDRFAVTEGLPYRFNLITNEYQYASGSTSLVASKDTYLDSCSPSTSHGYESAFASGGLATCAFRSLIGFNLLPYTITSASLSLYLDMEQSDYSRTISAYRVLRNWTEGSATWDKCDGTNSWGTAGCSNTTSDRESASTGSRNFSSTESTGWKNFPLATSYVDEMAKNQSTYFGFLLQSNNESTTPSLYWFDSKGSSNKPLLNFSYSKSSNYSVAVNFYDASSGGTLKGTVTIASESNIAGWKSRSAQFIPPAGSTYAEVVFTVLPGFGFYFDDIEVLFARSLYFTDDGLDSTQGLWSQSWSGLFGEFQFYTAAGARKTPTYNSLIASSPYNGHNAGTDAGNSADGDYAIGYIPLKSGTYSWKASYAKYKTMGKFDLYVDGIKVTTTPFDMYASTSSYNNEWIQDGITVAYNGVHEFKIVANGKNASSSDYTIQMSAVLVYRTA